MNFNFRVIVLLYKTISFIFIFKKLDLLLFYFKY